MLQKEAMFEGSEYTIPPRIYDDVGGRNYLQYILLVMKNSVFGIILTDRRIWYMLLQK